MVWHQAPGLHLDLGRTAALWEQIAIKRVISVFEERAGTTVATLRHMVRIAGDDDAGKASHVKSCPQDRHESIKCTVTVIRVATRGEKSQLVLIWISAPSARPAHIASAVSTRPPRLAS